MSYCSTSLGDVTISGHDVSVALMWCFINSIIYHMVSQFVWELNTALLYNGCSACMVLCIVRVVCVIGCEFDEKG